MRPVKLEIVHGGSAGRQMRRTIGRVLLSGDSGDCRVQVGRRHERTVRLGELVKVCLNFLGYVQDGLDSPLSETSPISNVILRTKPDTWQNLNGTIGVGNGGRSIAILSLSPEKICACVGEGDDGRTAL